VKGKELIRNGGVVFTLRRDFKKVILGTVGKFKKIF